MKVIGRRQERPASWGDADQLQRTMIAMRGTSCLVPRGVYRFKSFDEADQWLIRTMTLTYASLSWRTSRASAAR